MEATNRKTYTYQGKPISITEAAQLAGVNYKTMYTRLNQMGMSVEAAITKGGGSRSAEDKAVDDTMQALGYDTAEAVTEPVPEHKPAPPEATERIPEWKQQLRLINAAIDGIDALEEVRFDADEIKTKTRETKEELQAMRCRLYENYINWRKLAE